MCAAPKPAISPEGVALRENCSIRDIVQRALESYELRNAGREPAASFYAHFAAASHVDVIDIDAVIGKIGGSMRESIFELSPG